MLEHEFLGFIPGYVLGALSPQEQERLEEHLLEGCEICEPELRIYGETAGRLPHALPSIPLAPSVKGKVRLRLERENLLVPSASAGQKSGRMYLLIAAALVAAVFATFLYWKTNSRLHLQSGLLAQREAEITEMEKMLSRQKAEISWLRDPSVQLALLTAAGSDVEAKGKMIWHPVQHKGIFYVQYLPQLLPDKSYQLWVIGAEGPVSAGVFEPDQKGSAVLTVERIEGSLDGPPVFAVTIEPFGGVPKPTGTPILAGKPL